MQTVIRKLPIKKGNYIFLILFWGYTVFLFTVTLTPAKMVSAGIGSWISHYSFGNADKLVHFVLFFIFTVLLYFTRNKITRIYLIGVPVFTGILIEILQHLTGLGRTFEWMDILADTLGILLAYLFLRILYRLELSKVLK